MANHNNKSGRGRPEKDTSIGFRTEVFGSLFKMIRNNPGITEIGYDDVRNDIKTKLNRKTIKSIFNEIIRVCNSGITLGNRGLEIANDAYYQQQIWTEEKVKYDIANTLSKLIEKDQVRSLACSAGSTVKICFTELYNKGLYRVAVTNNLGIIDSLKGKKTANVILAGGEYKSDTHSCVGAGAVDGFKSARCEACIIGVSGINSNCELFVRYYEEVEVLRQIVRSATGRIYIVASKHKCSQEDTFSFISLKELLKEKPDIETYLITSDLSSPGDANFNKTIKALKDIKVKVVTCEEDIKK